MKYFNYLLVVLSCLTLLSCGGDDENEEEVVPLGTMSAKIDGEQWEANFASALETNGSLTIISDRISFAAFDFVSEPGTYRFSLQNPDYDDVNGYATYDNLLDGYFPAASTSGTITFTEINLERISGTFEFVAAEFREGAVIDSNNPENIFTGRELNITDGQFSLEVQ